MGLTGLAGLVYAAAPGASASALLSRSGREAIVEAATTAVRESVQIDVHKRGGYGIPRRFWGQAIQKLRPLRVVNDRMNVMIVLTEDGRDEKGLYVTNLISSYAVANTDPRFAAFEPLSKPGDRSFGGLYRYHIRKKRRPTGPR